MLRENNNVSNNFAPHKNKKFKPKKKDIREHHRDLVNKSLDT